MPTYDYKCEGCGHVFEVRHSMNETPRVDCPQCGDGAKKMITGGSGFFLKGSSAGSMQEAQGIRCGKEQTCCGKATPCDVRPCDK